MIFFYPLTFCPHDGSWIPRRNLVCQKNPSLSLQAQFNSHTTFISCSEITHPSPSHETPPGTTREHGDTLAVSPVASASTSPLCGAGSGGAGVWSTGDEKCQHAWLLAPVVKQGLTEPSPGSALLPGVHFKRWVQVPFPARVSERLYAGRWSTWHLAAMLLWARLILHKECGNQNVPVTGVNLCLTGTDLESGHN